MQEQEHTPGPWVRGSCDSSIIWARAWRATTETDGPAGPEAVSIAVVECPAFARERLDPDIRDAWLAETDANARLIAAAPDLLLALAWLHDLEQGRRPDEYADQKALAMAAARAAIAKATGAALPAPPAQGGDKTEDTLDGQ